MEDEAQVLAAAKKLPLCERVEHKNWKVRSEAYEDVRAGCERAFSSSDPMLNEAGPLLSKCVGDANANAMDKGLDALCAWLQKADESQASRIVSSVCSTLAAKCLKARPGTVTRATEACLLFIELEEQASVVESILKALSDKVPKVVLAALETLLKAVSEFGAPKVIDPKPLFKSLPAVFGHSNAGVRDKAKEITVELSLWLGSAVVQTVLVDKMNDTMKKDVATTLASLPPGKKKPLRYTRKEALARAAAQENDEDDDGAVPMDVDDENQGNGASGGDGDEFEQGDPYDFSDPVDIFSPLTKTSVVVGDDSTPFWDCFESKKWNIRKGALEKVKELARSNPRLSSENSSLNDLTRELKKILLKDANINCAASAADVVGALALGLRKDFSNQARQLCSAVLERFKEKNTIMSKAADDALRTMATYCYGLVDVSEDIATALAHKNPKVRLDTLRLLKYMVDATDKQQASRTKDALITAAVKLAPDADANIREHAQAVLVAYALKLGSYNAIQSFLVKLDDSRTKMIEEAVMEAAKSAGGKSSAPSTTATTTTTTVTTARARTASVSTSSVRTSPKAATAAAAAAATNKPSSSRSSRPAATSSSLSKAAATASTAEDDAATITSGRLSTEEADQLLTDAVGAAVVEGLRSAQWQERLESMGTITEHTTASVHTPEAASILLCLAQLPGWSDKNFQVVNKCLEIATILAKECPGYGKLHAAVTVEGAGDKIHELKHRIPATDALNAACEAIGPRFVLSQLHSRATANKNPKVLSESLAWMATVVEEFGLATVDLPALLSWLIADLGSPNAPVRNQAMGVLGRCHVQVGGGLMSQLAESLKPAQVTALEEIFRKNPVDPEFQPTRKVRAGGKKRAAGGGASGGAINAASVAAAVDDDNEGDDDEPGVSSLEDLLPRTSIAASLTSALIGQISSSNWKERNSALEEIENLVKSAGNRIQPDIPAADLFSALRGRMADTNRNLAARTLLLLGKLAQAIGQPFDKLARPVLVPALNTLSDNKKQVRDAVIVMLDAWVTTCPAEKIFAPVGDVISNPKVSADGRVAALLWMAKVIPSSIKNASATTVKLCTESAVRAAAIGLGDKAAAVRDGGSQLLAETAAAVGGDEMLRALNSLDSSMKKTAEPWVMKAIATSGTVSAAGAGAAAAGAPAAGGSRPASSSNRQHTATTTPAAAAAPSERPTTRAPATSTTASRPSTLSINDHEAPPLLAMSSSKAARSRTFRPRPGRFEAPPLDELDVLDAAFTGIASEELRSLMFSREFKDHVKAADSLASVVVPGDLLPEGIECLDIIFRWSVVRICEGNTQVLVRVLEMLRSILDSLLRTEYRISEIEAAVLLPGLIEKAGHNQDRVRNLHRDVLHGVCAIYSTSRVLDYLTAGLASKNSRTKVECCDAMAAVVETDGVSVLSASKAKPMAAIAATLKERDGTLRTAALGVIEAVWAQEGADCLWRLLGRLENREKDMVEDRLKRSSRQAGASQPSSYGQTNTEQHTDLYENSATPAFGHTSSSSLGGFGTKSSGGGGFGGHTVAGGGMHVGELAYSRPAFTPPNALDMTPPTAMDVEYINRNAASTLTPSAPTMYRPHAADAAAAAAAMSTTPVPPRNLPPTPTPQAFQSPSMVIQSVNVAASSPVPATGPDDLGFEQRWNEYLATMASPALPTAINATKQLCAEIMTVTDPATVPPASRRIRVVMGSSAERLFNLVLAQLGQIFEEAAKEAESGTAPSSRGCKFALNVMLQGMSVEEIAGGLPQGTLRRAISLLLCRLVDERGLLMFEEGTTLVRAVNVLIAKMLDSANKNYSFAALLQLLREPPVGLPESTVPKFNDLVVKCLIKLTKGLQINMDGVDMSVLLLNIHDFFMFLGVDEIRRRSSADDKPLRMVKTVLHELCKMAGHGIYVSAAGIPGRKADPQPIIFAYISLNLKSLEQSGLIAPATGEEQQLAEMEKQEKEMIAAKAAALHASGLGGEDSYALLPGADGQHPYSSSHTVTTHAPPLGGGGGGANDDAVTKADVKARLKGIMTRLVQRDTAQQKVAMVELFYLRKEAPEMVERLVFGKAGTSIMFREFIENGLAELEKNGVPSNVHTNGSSSFSSNGNTRASNTTTYNTANTTTTNTAPPPVSSSVASPAAPGSAKLSSLRERLSNIKSGDNTSAGHSSTVEELTARMQMLRRGAGN